MIKNNTTIDNIDISTLSVHSHKKVIKCCDFCPAERVVALRDIYRSRKKTSHGLDACKKCTMKQSGISRRKGGTLIGDGYYAQYDNEGKRQLLHRQIIEKAVGRKLLQSEVVHHIDGNKLNNNINNLCLCVSDSEHRSAHVSLETVGFDLVQKGLVIFDSNIKKYYIPYKENLFPISLGFENIAIKQKKNICKSRLDTNIQSEILRNVFRPIPLIAANMSTVINKDFYIKLYKAGAFGILHRAWKNEEDYLLEIKEISKECEWVAASIGIGTNQYELAKKLINNGSNIILIDIAHGYSDEVIDLGKKLKSIFPLIKLILGNTTNIEMIKEVSDFADGLKIGIAQGQACETKNTAGCTEKQFSAVLKFKELTKSLGLPIISDGGIRESADFVKAVGAGANSIMAGSIFAACPESAGELINIEGINKKLYAGMASEYVQKEWKGGLKQGTCAEGGVKYLDINQGLDQLLQHYCGSLRSGITYAGGKDIKSFQDNVEFIRLI